MRDDSGLECNYSSPAGQSFRNLRRYPEQALQAKYSHISAETYCRTCRRRIEDHAISELRTSQEAHRTSASERNVTFIYYLVVDRLRGLKVPAEMRKSRESRRPHWSYSSGEGNRWMDLTESERNRLSDERAAGAIYALSGAR